MPSFRRPVSTTRTALERVQGRTVGASQVNVNNPRNNNVSPPQAGD